MNRFLTSGLLLLLCLLPLALPAQRTVWTPAQANAWYTKQPWLAGSNYAPYNAINQLEMWQAETFDPQTIDKELGWANGLGFNTMRVFLHDKLWVQDPEGFLKRLETFLTLCQKHNIRPMLVLFDSVWDPHPQLGKQPEPKPGLHNSGWVQGPGADILADSSKYPLLESYVKGVVGHYRDDTRILAWDVWNEPDNTNESSYGSREPKNKLELVQRLLPQVFAWARAENPVQPLTCGIWRGDWSAFEKLTPLEKIQVEESDVISFHSYDGPAEFEKRVKWLQAYNRPLLCTEYMARGNNSTFKGIMPVAKKYNVAAYNWGFVAGKSNTIYPWDSWKKPYASEPAVWFHDIFRPSGKPYRADEVALIRQLTGVAQKAKTGATAK